MELLEGAQPHCRGWVAHLSIAHVIAGDELVLPHPNRVSIPKVVETALSGIEEHPMSNMSNYIRNHI